MKIKTECLLAFRQKNKKGDSAKVSLTFSSMSKREEAISAFKALSPGLQLETVGDRNLSFLTNNGKIKIHLSPNKKKREEGKELLRELQKTIKIETRVIYPKVGVSNKTKKRYRNFPHR